jgi:hypothetical protein
MTFIEVLKQNWLSIAIFGIIVVFILNLFGFIVLIPRDPVATIRIHELNYVADGQTIILTEDDFKEIPQLAVLIRDHNSAGGRVALYSSKDYGNFISRYKTYEKEASHIFEYQGKFYEYDLQIN